MFTFQNDETPNKNWHSPWIMMVGSLLSFWNGLCSRDIRSFSRGVHESHGNIRIKQTHKQKTTHISANGFLMTSSTDWSTCSSDAMKLSVNKIRFRIHVKGGLYMLVTLPETNRSHKSGSHPKRTLVFHPPYFILFLAGAMLVSQRVQASLFQSVLYITKFARQMPS